MFYHLILQGVMVGPGAYPSWTWAKAEYSLDIQVQSTSKSPVHRRVDAERQTTTRTHSHLWAIQNHQLTELNDTWFYTYITCIQICRLLFSVVVAAVFKSSNMGKKIIWKARMSVQNAEGIKHCLFWKSFYMNKYILMETILYKIQFNED